MASLRAGLEQTVFEGEDSFSISDMDAVDISELVYGLRYGDGIVIWTAEMKGEPLPDSALTGDLYLHAHGQAVKIGKLTTETRKVQVMASDVYGAGNPGVLERDRTVYVFKQNENINFGRGGGEVFGMPELWFEEALERASTVNFSVDVPSQDPGDSGEDSQQDGDQTNQGFSSEEKRLIAAVLIAIGVLYWVNQK